AADVVAADEPDDGDARLLRLADRDLGPETRRHLAEGELPVDQRRGRGLAQDLRARVGLESALANVLRGPGGELHTMRVVAGEVGVDQVVDEDGRWLGLAAGGVEDAARRRVELLGANNDHDEGSPSVMDRRAASGAAECSGSYSNRRGCQDRRRS